MRTINSLLAVPAAVLGVLVLADVAKAELYSSIEENRAYFGPARQSSNDGRKAAEFYDWGDYHLEIEYAVEGEKSFAESIVCMRKDGEALSRRDIDVLLGANGLRSAPDKWRPFLAGPADGPETVLWVWTTPDSRYRSDDLRNLSEADKKAVFADERGTAAIAELIKPRGIYGFLLIQTYAQAKSEAGR